MTDKEFSTDSTPLAAYLITEGYILLDTTPPDKRGHIFFIFKNNSSRLLESVKAFETLRAISNSSILIRNYQDLVKRALREKG